MTIRMMRFTMITVLAGLFLFACNLIQNEKGELKTTKSGIGYKFHVENKSAKMPEIGSILTMRLDYGTEDTIFYSSSFIPEGVMLFQLSESEYEGDLYEALAMMHVGDSASFMLDAESFFLKTARFPEIPEFAEGIDKLLFNVKLEKAQSEAEREAELEEEMAEARMAEEDKIKQYLEDNNITTQPNESGMYYIEHTRGKGASPKAGDRVKVHYTGTLLDGTKFDSSVDRNQPFEFVLGRGQVIPGWDEGIALMNEGTKANFVLPSHMAYGERGAGASIPPFAPLVFEVELLEVIR